MSVTSEEINYLIYRYLQESGFFHTAFTFASESSVSRAKVNASDVPVGSLITYLQKGLQYKELETHITEDGRKNKCEASFSLCKKHECKISTNKRKNKRVSKASKKNSSSTSSSYNNNNYSSNSSKGSIPLINDIEPMKMKDDVGSSSYNSDQTSQTKIKDDQVAILKGHTSEVIVCAWNPKFPNILASGSGDSTARIWNVPDNLNTIPNPIVLEHYSSDQQKSKDVTTLDWNQSGTLLATGSYDGFARIWTNTGNLLRTLKHHEGPIFSLKWNKRGDLLLSGSVDRTAIIWDASTGEVKQQFGFHTAPTLDVDWRNNFSFATCSTDYMIYVCELGKDSPVRCMKGHQHEVNAIKWDPSGSLLASCSDDTTAKIWSMNQEKCVHDFTSHKREIYTIKWNGNKQNPILASASFDTTIKLWDVDVGACIMTLSKHLDPVYSVAFSPNGEYLASGSFDRCLHIWSTKDGSLVKTYQGDGGIFEVCWNSENRVAASYSNHTLSVIDLRK